MAIRKNKVSEAISLVLMGMTAFASGNVYAQQSNATADDDSETEVIEVRGIRSSLAKSLSVKQDASGFVDAITAEDVGKLPDNNVAEALQRVAGVSIERSRGEGDFISIRGLGADFVKGTMNGRTLLSSTESVDPIFNGVSPTSAGRATNFDILPSELVTSLEVAKSASANQIEGGIAGSVDAKTARPLTLGNKAAFSATGTYREFNEQTDPSLSGLYSWSNDSNVGFLATASYSKRTIREDFSRSFLWLPVSIFGAAETLDTNNDGTGDVSGVYQPLSNNAEVFEGERERFTFGTTLQWAGDKSEFVLDTLFSKREIEEGHQNFIFLPIAITNLGAVNPDGSQQAGDAVINDAAVNLDSTTRPEITNGTQINDEDLFAIGANYTIDVAEWALSFDASYSKSEGSYDFERARWDADNGTFAFNTQLDQGGYTIRQQNQADGAAADLGNLENWVLTGFDQRNANNIDTEHAFKFDAVRDLDSDYISSIELGIRYSKREKQLATRDNGGDIQNIRSNGGLTLLASDVVGGVERGQSNFLDDQWDSNIDYSNLPFPVYAAIAEEVLRQRATILAIPEADRTAEQNELIARINNAVGDPVASPTRSFTVTEDVFAAYFQANIDTEIGGMPLTGDIGIRYVQTDVEVDGQSASFVITDLNGTNRTDGFDLLESVDPQPINFENDYDNVLPSFNLRLEVAEGMFVRASASKTISRAPLDAFRPSLTGTANAPVDVQEDGFQLGLSGGNPELEPFESTNFDIGFEYYFGDASAFYIAAFKKDLENYVVQGSTLGPITEIAGTPVPVTGIVNNGGSQGQGPVGQVPVDVFTSPINAAEGDITGVEVGLQQGFESGFGYIANISTVDSEATFRDPSTGDQQSVNFFGVSDLSYNLTGYYEAGPFQARLSYNYRDEYLVDVNTGLPQEFVNDEYGQLDASLSYDLNENLTLVFSAINLNDEDQRVFVDLPVGGRQFYSTSHIGPRFSLGIRGSL